MQETKLKKNVADIVQEVQDKQQRHDQKYGHKKFKYVICSQHCDENVAFLCIEPNCTTDNLIGCNKCFEDKGQHQNHDKKKITYVFNVFNDNCKLYKKELSYDNKAEQDLNLKKRKLVEKIRRDFQTIQDTFYSYIKRVEQNLLDIIDEQDYIDLTDLYQYQYENYSNYKNQKDIQEYFIKIQNKDQESTEEIKMSKQKKEQKFLDQITQKANTIQEYCTSKVDQLDQHIQIYKNEQISQFQKKNQQEEQQQVLETYFDAESFYTAKKVSSTKLDFHSTQEILYIPDHELLLIPIFSRYQLVVYSLKIRRKIYLIPNYVTSMRQVYKDLVIFGDAQGQIYSLNLANHYSVEQIYTLKGRQSQIQLIHIARYNPLTLLVASKYEIVQLVKLDSGWQQNQSSWIVPDTLIIDYQQNNSNNSLLTNKLKADDKDYDFVLNIFIIVNSNNPQQFMVFSNEQSQSHPIAEHILSAPALTYLVNSEQNIIFFGLQNGQIEIIYYDWSIQMGNRGEEGHKQVHFLTLGHLTGVHLKYNAPITLIRRLHLCSNIQNEDLISGNQKGEVSYFSVDLKTIFKNQSQRIIKWRQNHFYEREEGKMFQKPVILRKQQQLHFDSITNLVVLPKHIITTSHNKDFVISE